MIFASVDLPAPFSPTKPWMLPAGISKSTSLRTGVENDLQIALATIAWRGSPRFIAWPAGRSGRR